MLLSPQLWKLRQEASRWPYNFTRSIAGSARWQAASRESVIRTSVKKSPFLLFSESAWVTTSRLLLLPFEELAVGLSSRVLVKEATRGEQSADPSGNTCPRLVRLQNNSSACHLGQEPSLGSATWLSFLPVAARASVVTVMGKEIEMFWGVMAWRVTSVAMGSLSEGFGVIHIVTRSYFQKTRTCQKNKLNQPGLRIGLLPNSSLI